MLCDCDWFILGSEEILLGTNDWIVKRGRRSDIAQSLRHAVSRRHCDLEKGWPTVNTQ